MPGPKDLSYETIPPFDSKLYGSKKDYGIKTFVFNMNRHFIIDPRSKIQDTDSAENDEYAMDKIAIWLLESIDSDEWLDFSLKTGRLHPLWIFFNWRIAHITQGHPLWSLLDDDSRNNAPTRNYLIWNGHIKNDGKIIVTHFGPLGPRQESNMKRDFRQGGDEYWKELSKTVKSLKDWNRKTKSEQDQDRAEMWLKIDQDFLKCQEKKINAIDRIKSDLKDVIKQAYGSSDQTGIDLCLKVDQQAVWIALDVAKIVGKHLESRALFKLSAKIAGKSLKATSKPLARLGGRSAAKKVPVIGAVLGVAFGIGRLCQGDLKMAGMELLSGGASLYPGAGTALSFGIDLKIAQMDIKGDVDEYETHNAKIQGNQ